MPHTMTPVADMPEVQTHQQRTARRIARALQTNIDRYTTGQLSDADFEDEVARLTQLASEHRG